jgi:RHS repeat-associated protein
VGLGAGVALPRRMLAAAAAALLLAVLGAALLLGLVGRSAVLPHTARRDAVRHPGLSSLPLAAQGVVSAALGSESGAYRVSGLGDEYRAVNPAQRLRASFDRAGVRVQSGDLRLGLRLGAVGYGASLAALAPAAPRTRGNRVVYARAAGVSEWYTNGPLGLEQGFTLARSPAGGAGGPLTLSLSLSGGARASVGAGGESVTFAGAGRSSLRYGDLMATDARGRALHSWITLQGRRVLLHVDARGARYPLRIDPLIQQGEKLTGDEEVGEGWFGFAVALSANGNTALIGAAGDNKFVGAVWVFTRSEGVWTQQGDKLTGKEETGAGEFGTVVALSSEGTTALIGGPTDNSNAGAAWVFTLSGGKWSQQGGKLTGGSEESGKGEFGYGVALSSNGGNTALIGGPSDNSKAGGAWVFTRSGETWSQQGKKLTGNSKEEEVGEGEFGFKVALSSEGNTALIGGFKDNEERGAAWVFTRETEKWTQQGKKLTGGTEETGKAVFGYSVALSSNGNTALIGGPADNKVTGAAWVFTRSEGVWTQQGKKLTAAKGEEVGEGYFGESVALSSEGNIALIGGDGNSEDTGAAWVFTRETEKWTQQGKKLTGEEESGAGKFGFRVALSAEGTTALIGGFGDNKNAGAAWVFTSSGGKWTQQGKKLTAKEEAGERYFGLSVALSSNGNTALIGGELDNEYHGAAWVFTRSEGKWSQQGPKLTGGEEEAGAGRFGSSVALSAEGNTALIGGTLDNSDVGAAWVFIRTEGKWTQQGKKLTSGEGAFGDSVALSANGSTALIGGLWADSFAGAAWVFTRSEGKWTQQEKLTGGEEEAGLGRFGNSVALSAEGNTALIGGAVDNSDVGAAWVFTRSGETWSQQGKKLKGEEEAGKAEFGSSVALSAGGNTALIGGAFDNGTAGAAWVFTRSEGTWAQQGKKLTVTGKEEGGYGRGEFGSSVALSSDGSTALIGGAATESGLEAPVGAAWMFTRSQGVWTQQGAKLTGATEEIGNGEFGYSVALSSDGSTALIGGPHDNSNVGAAWVFGAGFSNEESYGCENAAEPNLRWYCVPSTVNVASGNLSESQSDLTLGGRGPGLRLTRTYNSQLGAEQSAPGPFGYGWTASYGAHLTVNKTANTATVYQENGSAVVFSITASEEYVGIGPRVLATLVKEGSNYIYTLPNLTKLEFNSEGKLVKETERNGNSNTLTYNGSKQLEKVTDSASRSLTFKYNEEGLLESVKDPLGHIVSYTYVEKQLASVTIEGKERWKFEYEAPHLLKKITDGRGHVTTIKYETSTHRVTEEEVGGHHRKLTYGNEETTITEPNGSETVATFNAAGEPTKITRAKGVTGVETTTEYEYQSSTYALARMINGDKDEWKYADNSEGDETSETDPNGDERKWEYDKKRDVIKETTPEGETTTIKRNSSGEPEAIERPIGSGTQKTEYKYNAKGDLEEEINPLGRATKYTYDAYGDKATEKDPEGNERKWKYNEDSQETEETNARGYTTKIERDERGLPGKITDPLSHAIEYKYDGNQNIESETDGNKHAIKYEYNEENLRTKVIEPNGNTAEASYDSEGKMTSRIEGNGHKWEYKRNALEQVTEEKNPLGKTWKKTYEKAGDLEKLEDPEKHTTEYTYDESDRLEKIKYSTGTPSGVTFEYNKDSKVTKMTDETGTTENTWDKLDRLTKYKNGAGKVVEYEYNLANLPTKITYPNKEHITREYDKDNRLEKVTDWKGNTTSFKYNADSELEKTTFPSASEDKDEYAYNEADQISEVKMLKGATELGKLVYERDGDNQVKKTTTKVLPGPEVNETKYDENNRLIEANKKAYEYDKANNPTKLEGAGTDTYNEADQLKEGPEAKYSFNEDGQRTKTTPTTGPATTYGYDQAGNLTSVERPKEGSTPEIKDSYTYSGNNLRQTQTINGTKTNLTWDTAEELPIILEDETNSYIYGPENLPIEQISSGGTILYLHHDQQGSTRLLTNKEGKTETTYTYNPYGSLEASTGTATTPLRYDGQYTSTDTGLIYLRARSYDPTTAQFLTIDPALETTGEPYDYTKDNPLNHADPTGNGYWPWEWSNESLKNVATGATIAGLVITFLPFPGAAVGGAALTIIASAINVVVGAREISEEKTTGGLRTLATGLAIGGGAFLRLGSRLPVGSRIEELLSSFGWMGINLGGYSLVGAGISAARE